PPGKLMRSADLALDWRALAFVLALSLSATVLFAIAPALLAGRLDLDAALRSGSRGGAADPAARRKLDLLIASEVALAFVLLFSAGLFTGSYSRLASEQLGFDPHNVLATRIVPSAKSGFSFARVLTKAQSIPGVERAALVNGLPLDFPAGTSIVRGTASLSSLARVVTPEYFRVMSIPLLRGRAFT